MNVINHTKYLEKLPRNFFLFGYGANNVENLAKRLFGDLNGPGTTEEIELMHLHSEPGFLRGWKRIFFGHSGKWDGSVASLKESNPSLGTYGVLTKMKREGDKFYVGPAEANLEGLFQVEAVDEGMYRFQPVATFNGLYVYSFVGNLRDYPPNKPPSESYLEAIRKTMYYSNPRLRKGGIVEIPIEYE